MYILCSDILCSFDCIIREYLIFDCIILFCDVQGYMWPNLELYFAVFGEIFDAIFFVQVLI